MSRYVLLNYKIHPLKKYCYINQDIFEECFRYCSCAVILDVESKSQIDAETLQIVEKRKNIIMASKNASWLANIRIK